MKYAEICAPAARHKAGRQERGRQADRGRQRAREGQHMGMYATCPICGRWTDEGSIYKTRGGGYTLVCMDCGDGLTLEEIRERIEGTGGRSRAAGSRAASSKKKGGKA